jgi:hypothetical protein
MAKVKGYVLSNIMQFVITLLLTLLIGVYAHNLKRVNDLEVRVWTLETQKAPRLDLLESRIDERTAALDKRLTEFCHSVNTSIDRLEGLLVKFLRENGMSKKDIDQALEAAGPATAKKEELKCQRPS